MLGIFVPTILLAVFGVFNLLGIKKELVPNHLLNIGLGLVAYFFVKKMGPIFFRHNNKFFYWAFVALLIITYIIGIEVKGSQRWINLYFLRFQPSEFFKVFFVIFLADFFSKKRRFEFDTGLFFTSVFYFIIPTLIIFKQPDLGTAMVFAAIFVVMSLFSGMSRKYMIYLFIFLLISMPVMWNVLHDYQRNRILAFVNPSVNQESTSYNMTQAIITSGSGQLTGRGLGMSKQSKLYFLPEYHTDFAYSSLVEQFGFIGGGAVILLYISWAVLMITKLVELYQSTDEKKRYQFLYTLGFFTFIIFQVFVNIGMNLGVLPIAGITLPLISYGGSSLITYFIALALL